MKAQPQFVVASCDQVWQDQQLGRDYFRSTRGLTKHAVPWLVRNGGGVLSASVLRAAAVRALGGFDTTYPTGHDSWLLLRLALTGPWAHCPGRPVLYGRNSTQEGEAPHLCQQFHDYLRQWAELHERFIQQEGGRRVLSDRFCNHELAHRWYRAGCQLASLGLNADANDCFHRSLRYRFRLKTAFAWLKNRAAA